MTHLSPDTLLLKLEQELRPLFEAQNPPLMIGIQTGGYLIAEELHRRIQPAEPLGKLNITFYRDDFTKIGLHPTVQPSFLPVDIDSRSLILIDDVIYSGRTIRAAMNELFDYGRPSQIRLAILIDRGGRELPIQPDFCGTRLELSSEQQIKLEAGSPMKLTLTTKS